MDIFGAVFLFYELIPCTHQLWLKFRYVIISKLFPNSYDVLYRKYIFEKINIQFFKL